MRHLLFYSFTILDGASMRRSSASGMANEDIEELRRQIMNGSISSQGLSQARSNPMPGAPAGNSLNTTAVNFLNSECAVALAQGNNNFARPEPVGLPAGLMALMGTVKGIEGPVSADGRWPIDPNDATYITATTRLSPAEDHFKRGEYNLASKIYMDVMRYLLGSEHPLPGDDNESEYGVESSAYRPLSIHRRMLLIRCCQKMAMCNLNLHEGKVTAKTLAWLNEAEIIGKNRHYAGSSSHAWTQPASPTLVDLALTECLTSKAKLLDAIGNSSAYQHYATLAGRLLLTLPPWNKYAGAKDSKWLMSAAFNNHYKNQDSAPPLSQRHPDPKSDQRYQIIDSGLQVRGAWKKEYIEKDGVLPKTYNETVFIWGGYLYSVRAKIAAGVGEQPGIPELRRISLKQRTKWENVTKFPAARGRGLLNGVCIDGNNMYAFSGHPQMDIFNLSTKKWTTVKTTWKPTATDRRLGIDPVWPWPKRIVSEAVAEIVNGRLYVFGGLNIQFSGCNLFMELDLKTLKWRRLSGTFMIEEHDPHIPGPRAGSGSWVSPDRKRLYIFSGICKKARKGISSDKPGPSAPWMYDDMWSWDIATETWREEKVQGSHPSPRMGMGSVFSRKLNAAVIFGGANDFVRTNVGDSSKSELYAGFYADTYMWNSPPASPSNSGSTSKPGHWRQIQTVGFPNYRMFCHLIIDPDTEDIYLYGGEVIGDSIPSKTRTEEQRKKRRTHESPLAEQMATSPEIAEIARELGVEHLGATSYTVRFGDLWKLHVDVPGGSFEAVDMEDELRTARLGPWQRCFECRNVGFWKKCGGSCSGKAFFCSTDCQTKGWKAHKELNGCRKKSS